MLQGGVYRRYLRRRLLAVAWDDIGLADPNALQLVSVAVRVSERLGANKVIWPWRPCSWPARVKQREGHGLPASKSMACPPHGLAPPDPAGRVPELER
ncbi:hypothetical protein HWD96_26275 [Pseudomonas putida]|uniref:AAA family ATPase n=1 Tax=Pseudomonas putida TaxID=303 RepID=UPI003D69D01C|nr:hypothetical protein [Pseudomonas putida]